jgi:pantoate--beta-alanine ligase
MVRDLSMPVRIQVCPTLREADGLAMSSRNTYLQPSERPAAGVLYRALSAAKMVCEGGGGSVPTEVSRDAVIAAAKHVLQQEPLVTQIEYISVASPDNMRELPTVRAKDHGAVISAAVRLGSVRLIDNLLVGRAISKLLPSAFTR